MNSTINFRSSKESPWPNPWQQLFCLYNRNLPSLPGSSNPIKPSWDWRSLVDLARDKAHARTKRFSTILRQCCPLLGKPHFQSVLLNLVGDKENVEVAKAIQKSLRSSASCWPTFAPPRPGFPHRSPNYRYGPRPQPTCFNSSRRRHIARFCPKDCTVLRSGLSKQMLTYLT